MTPFSLYIHVPYCLHKCPYCDFNTYALSHIPEQDYVTALLSELDTVSREPHWKGRTVQSIYFGGGTPSLFHPTSIGKIIGTISRCFPLDPLAEISLEANPGTIDNEIAELLGDAGINRISLGAQSFQPKVLETLGRIHSSDQIVIAYEILRSAGFTNLSLDLMYGVPGQSLEDVQEDLNVLQSLRPEHVSAYGLTIEKGTPFYQSVKSGKMKLPPEGLILEMMEYLQEFLPQHGYAWYEISNYAQAGRQARHNLAYWNRNDYLGLGAGSHSYYVTQFGKAAKRYSNYALPVRYIEEANACGHAASWHDELSQRDLMFEFFFLGLRKIQGVTLASFRDEFGVSVEEVYGNILEVLVDQGLIKKTQARIHLTEKGLLLADSVIGNFAEIDFEPVVPIHPSRDSFR
ncbi:MAG: radical SAM family heme chaperone HemW [Bdellovibrionales bacterium]|nr:radical SAM family heme chaperone HemW [Bdellovibrionales bacterium]